MSHQPAPHRIFPLGQDGVLVRFGDDRASDPQTALRFCETVRRGGISGITEIASSLASVLVRFNPEATPRAAIITQLRALLAEPLPATLTTSRLWTIPACFGGTAGPQLAEAAALADRTPEAAISELTTAPLSILAIGFAPGQPYLGHLPPNWGMQRQDALTPQVPAGAIAVALRQLVLFANASPTGWRWIGQSAFRVFVPDRAEPFALRPRDLVRFTATDASTLASLQTAADGLGGATCKASP